MNEKQLLEPQVYELLINVKKEIIEPDSLLGYSDSDLVAEIVELIIEAGDRLETPIYRIDNLFFVYKNGQPIEIPKKGFQEFLAWCGKHIGIDNSIVYDIPFRNQLFGRCWWKMEYQEPELELVEVTTFPDIFSKLELHNSKPKTAVTEFWKHAAPDLFVCKISGRKLTGEQFSRYQLARGGTLDFVTECEKIV